MRKLMVLCLGLVVGCFAGSALAEDLAGRFSVGVVGGGVYPKDSETDSSFYAGGQSTYGINEYIAVGGEVGYSSWGVEEGGIDYGEVRAVPLLADLYLRYPIEVGKNKLVPYVVGGLGVVFYDYKESSFLKQYGVTVNIDPSFALKLGGGIEYFLTKNIALGAEGSYIWSEADVSVSGAGAVASSSTDTNALIVAAGVKYYF